MSVFEDFRNRIESAKTAGVNTVFIPDLKPCDDTVREFTDETYDSLVDFVEKNR